MSASGQKRTWRDQVTMSALPPKADIRPRVLDVCFGPLSEVAHRQMSPGDEINFGYVSGSIRILNLPLFAVFVAAARFPAAQG
jgi:hypothetical protein